MPSIRSAAVLVAVAALGTAGSPAAPAGAAPPAGALSAPAGGTAAHPGLTPASLRIGRETLPADDRWAAAGAGTTGGSTADDAHVTVVRNRAELVAALGGDNATNTSNATPKIVYVSGKIDLRVDAGNKPVGCDAFADPDYSLDAFLAAYDPAVWGTTAKPSGPLEDARARSAKNQGATVKINVGRNTTIIGIDGGRLTHGSLALTGVSNVIIRNVEVTDAADCFPAWDPTDGSTGNWNSLYDLISLSAATNVWIDHNTLSDGNNHDRDQPLYFGRPYQVHDGATDIIRGSDQVTVSYNDYYDHDKTMLIGSTDTPGVDVGRLRVTVHHNRFANVGQRAPRVRFGPVDVGRLRVTVHHNRFANVGQRAPRVRFGPVDVYNNLYIATEDAYEYSLGAGLESAVYAENNFVRLSADIPASEVIRSFRGTRL